MALIDELAPDFVGKRLLKLSLNSTETPRAFSTIDVAIELLDEALTYGLILPMELTVTPPSPSGFYRKLFRRVIPIELSFIPREGGLHTVSLREVGHNRWWGALAIDVAGDRADPRVTG